MKKQNKLVAWLAYPTVMSLGIGLHYLVLAWGWGLQMSAYVPVTVCALIITALELRFPHRNSWSANGNDIANDATYLVLVQILLPKFLSFFVAITLLRAFQEHNVMFSGWWPHDWPVAVQAVLMLLVADFLRYWLHRAAHTWDSPLWWLHAVHHSPKKLYWANFGRFHPIEKTFQFVLETLPFILLGVSADVLTLFFVFYSVNIFFQHCNIEMRLGWLNYIISGPELHRWHHSREVWESNNNYGNNLIIWDLLFGTYFFPRNRQVDELGLLNRNYPLGFLSQMETPFIRDLEKEQDPETTNSG